MTINKNILQDALKVETEQNYKTRKSMLSSFITKYMEHPQVVINRVSKAVLLNWSALEDIEDFFNFEDMDKYRMAVDGILKFMEEKENE